MALVVFMRGVNVGGNKTFQPSVLAKGLEHFEVVNVGAAGTFVVRGAVGQTALRAELLRRVPFVADVMICRGREIVDLVEADPFPDGPAHRDMRRYVAVLAKRPGRLPSLPITQPAGDQWEVKLIDVIGRFALYFWRRVGPSIIDTNLLVEKTFGARATTRNWNTIVKIGEILKTK